MIGSFVSGTNVSLVAKNGTKNNILQLLIKSLPVDKSLKSKSFIKQTPLKSGNSDSKYNLEIFKNLKPNSKKTP